MVAALGITALPGGLLGAVVLLGYQLFRGRIPDALIMTILISLANPTLFDVERMTVPRLGLLMIGLLLIWPGMHLRDKGTSWALAFFAAILAFSSFTVSQLPALSLIKGGLFIAVLWTFFNTQRIDWTGFARRFDRFIPLYLLLCLPTFLISAIGFARNGTGFQGLTNHPQAFGVICSLFATWTIYRVWNRTTTLTPHVAALTVISLPFFIIASEARTSLIATLAAVLVTWFIQLIRQPRHIGATLLLTMMFAGAGLYLAQSSDVLERFLTKRTSSEDVFEAASASRGRLVENSLTNFNDAPLLGIGFGIPSDLQTAEITYEPITGLPISAIQEKGVWVPAALEEQGVVGFALLSMVFAAFALFALRTRAYFTLPMLAYLLTANLGEMTMFSMGALGLIQWIVLFAALNQRERLQPEREQPGLA